LIAKLAEPLGATEAPLLEIAELPDEGAQLATSGVGSSNQMLLST
jgi:hypothetical protein